jgi:bifunctional enzyme CysN/CysC
VRVEAIERVIDASNLESQSARAHVERHQVAQCVLQLQRAVAFDLTADLAATSRFVIVDNYEISGGGIIFEGIADKESWVRDKVLERNSRWESSLIPAERRAERYSQTPALVLITGESRSDRKGLAKQVESRLFEDGRVVYFLGMGNVLHGIDADVEPGPEHRLEHFRRLGEVANLLLDAGMILVVSAAEVADDELQILRTAVADRITTVWIGDAMTTDETWDLVISEAERAERGYEAVKRLLQAQGVIFRPR